MSTVEASRRFRAVETPAALPGCCYICRNHEGPFIDTNISEDFFGVVYLCETCIIEMAREFGLITPDEFDDLKKDAQLSKNRASTALSQLESVREENYAIRRTIAAIGRSGGDSMDGVDNTENDESRDGTDGETTTESAVVSPGTIKGRAKSGSDE